MNPFDRRRTVLIEAENLLRTLLARLLLLSERFSLVADFADLQGAREACRRLRPELVVIDVDFAPEESVALIEVLQQEQPEIRVLALSESNDPALLHQIYRAKVHGYVARSEPLDLLEEAMHEVAEGRTYFPAAFIRAQQEFVANRDRASSILTEQEREILRQVAGGQTSREIAAGMQLSPRSVETYRYRIMRKLGLSNVAALVEYAFRSGIAGSPAPIGHTS